MENNAGPSQEPVGSYSRPLDGPSLADLPPLRGATAEPPTPLPDLAGVVFMPLPGSGTLLRPQTLTQEHIRQWIDTANALAGRYLEPFEPGPLTQTQINYTRYETQELLRAIRELERRKAALAPAVNSTVESSLFLNRMNYRLRLGRLFRINDLPREILKEIFHYVVWSWPDPTRGHKSREAVAGTCTLWREMMLADPNMWNVIWFKDDSGGCNIEKAKLWFQRSAAAHKWIRISDGREAHPMTSENMREIVSTINTSWSTVKVLVVILHHWDPCNILLAALQQVNREMEPMVLSRLEMHRTSHPYISVGSNQPALEAPSLFGGASVPTLRHFALQGIHINWNTSSLAHLTTFDLRRISLSHGPTLTQFRDILSSSPFLRKLVLDGAGPNYVGLPQDRTLPPIVLPRLKLLILVDVSAVFGVYTLSQIAAPNLRDLTLMNLTGENYGQLYRKMTGAFPGVKILTVYSASMEFSRTMDGREVMNPKLRAIMLKWLHSMPELTFLRLSIVDKHLLELFVSSWPEPQQPESVIIGPQVKILEFQSVEEQWLLPMMNTRKALGYPFQKVYIREPTAAQLAHNRLAAIEGAMAPGGRVWVMRIGAKSPEEIELQDS
ncbi:hypothetical protein BKA70DRAFT_319518 [Coprinopsis sp. MPI-PUGE-AT-0042]|nr:hypothetical protein BKA70DRAFT_319518 [Coprinopsis sp. MPI-PUGE-AT-0042]